MSLPVFIKNDKGEVFVNPAKRYTRPFWANTESNEAIPEIVTVPSNATSDPISIPIDQTGHLEVAYLLYQSTRPFLITVKDPGRMYTWMNKPIHIETMAGTAQRPLILPETYFLNVARGSRQLTVQFTDLDEVPIGTDNKIRLSMHGRKFLYNEAPADIYAKFQEFFNTKERTNLFFLTVETPADLINVPLSGAAGDTVSTEFRVTSDAYYELVKMTAVAHEHGDPATPAPYEFTIEEFATGRKLMNGTVRGESGFGTGQYPFIPFETYLLERDYRLKLTVTNLHTVASDFYFTLIGRRIPLPEEIRR